MDKHIVDTLKQLWHVWDNIAVFMLISLIIQALLTYLAPYRKRCVSGYFKFGMWSLYLSADAVALYTIGMIASIQRNSFETGLSPQDMDLQVFWAPFLILHLGGPDTITALALEDNELWHRHALQLTTQVIVTVYVITLSISRKNYNLLPPTLFMFINGFFKYYERTCALYFASVDVIRDSLKEPMTTTYEEMIEELLSAQVAHIPRQFGVKYGPSVHNRERSVEMHDGRAARSLDWNQVKETEEMIIFAYQFFEKSKGLLAEDFLSIKDDGAIRQFFLNRPLEEAFKILEAELNLIYDVLHTKVLLTNGKLVYLRVISIFSVITSLLLFVFCDQSIYNNTNIFITYVLLGGAIMLDISTFVLFVHSDWCVILVSRHDTPKPFKSCLSILWKWSSFTRNLFQKRRWSDSISQYNLLECTSKEQPIFFKIILVKQIKDALIDWKYVEESNLEKSCLMFIIRELQEKAKLASDDVEAIREVLSARGNLVFQKNYHFISEFLLPWTLDIAYDQSLLTWHLATDICYWATPESDREQNYCKHSKALSDYMLYILVRRQALVPQLVGRSIVRFEDTMIDVGGSKSSKVQFCKYVIENEIDEISAEIAIAKDSQSVYYEACRLAKQLNMFQERQWEIMNKVCVEMLCYAAIHSSPRAHFAHLRNGGELITFVWLLSIHLGLREPIQLSQGLRATKLTIYN